MEGAPTPKLNPRTKEVEGEGGRHGTKELGAGDKTRTFNRDNSTFSLTLLIKPPALHRNPRTPGLIQDPVTAAGRHPRCDGLHYDGPQEASVSAACGHSLFTYSQLRTRP